MSINIKCPWPEWEVTRVLGKGGFGTVYEIRRELYGTAEKAAMKVVTVPDSEEAITSYYVSGYDNESIGRKIGENISKILGEYKKMKSLGDCPNIVRCDDVTLETLPDEIRKRVCIRMELLTPLDKYLLSDNIHITDELVIQIGRDICEALKECERQNIVHRDIKPSNILVSETGRFKLGDFGISRTLDHTTKVTRAGTWEYIAPEIYKMEKSNKRADIYSLGLVLYWLLNNRKFPFYPMDRIPTSEEEQEAFSKRIKGEAMPEPLGGNRKLKEVILKACAYKPEDRYDSAARMQEALTQALGYTGSSEATGSAGRSRKTNIQTGKSSYYGKTQGNSWDDSGSGSIDERYWNRKNKQNKHLGENRETENDNWETPPMMPPQQNLHLHKTHKKLIVFIILGVIIAGILCCILFVPKKISDERLSNIINFISALVNGDDFEETYLSFHSAQWTISEKTDVSFKAYKKLEGFNCNVYVKNNTDETSVEVFIENKSTLIMEFPHIPDLPEIPELPDN